MQKQAFLQSLIKCIVEEVEGLATEEKLSWFEKLVEIAASLANRPTSLQIIPFIPGRHPFEEINCPGIGSSSPLSGIVPFSEGQEHAIYVLYKVHGLNLYQPHELSKFSISVSLSFAGPQGTGPFVPLSAWQKKIIKPQIFIKSDKDKGLTKDASWQKIDQATLVLCLPLKEICFPTATPNADADTSAQTSIEELFAFKYLFTQILQVELQLNFRHTPIALAQLPITMCDFRRLGSLYRRLSDSLIVKDTQKQLAENASIPSTRNHTYHPFYPIVQIFLTTSQLMTEALTQEILHQKRHFIDPLWLLHLEIYLEFITCLGIIEAAKQDIGDLLTSAEREAFAQADFALITERLNTAAWQDVWQLHEMTNQPITTCKIGDFEKKYAMSQKAILAHYKDLQKVWELIEPNFCSAQEIWQHRLRTVERAIFQKKDSLFPELAFLNTQNSYTLLWQEKNAINLSSSCQFLEKEGWIEMVINQTLASMNEVATWAKKKQFMDYIGSEAIPLESTLLWSKKENKAYFDLLQKSDVTPIDFGLESKFLPDLHQVLRKSPFFNSFSKSELNFLASTSRLITLKPLERIVIQGEPGSSLFIVLQGVLEAFIRDEKGQDQKVSDMHEGEIFGEISLLTGSNRATTVRAALAGAQIIEISKLQCQHLFKLHPELMDILGDMMAQRLANQHTNKPCSSAAPSSATLIKQIKNFFFPAKN